MKKIIVIFISILVLPILTYAQNPSASLHLNTGNDTIVSCRNQPLSFVADYTKTYTTSSYTVDSIAYCPPVSYTIGNQVLVNIDDMYSNTISLPFSFCFFENSNSYLIIGTNGLISFDVSYAGGYCNWTLSAACPDTSLPLNAIFGPYQDLDPSVGGEFLYKVVGTYPDRMFVLNINSVPIFSCYSLLTTSQIVLYEGTNIIDVYLENKPLCSTWNGGNTVIGIQDSAGTTGYSPPGRNTSQWQTTHEAWRFMPSGPPTYSFSWWADGNIISSADSLFINTDTSMSVIARLEIQNCDSSIYYFEDTVSIVVLDTGSLSISSIPQFDTICRGESVNLHASGADSYLWSPAIGLSSNTGASIIATPLNSISYVVYGTDSAGNTGCSVSLIKVNFADINLGADTSVCGNVVFPINAGAGYDSYAWSTGDTTQNILIDTISSGLGSQDVFVTVEKYGCFATDTLHLSFYDCTGISEIQSNRFSIYPNPVDDFLILNNSISEKTEVFISDIRGSLISASEFADASQRIDLSDFRPGMYFLTVRTQSGSWNFKIIKE
jgi:hypothetical protein